MKRATKQQLLTICLYENCSLEEKYKAAAELQRRYIPEDIRADMIYRLGTGIEAKQIAAENGLDLFSVVHFLRNFRSRHKEVTM